CGRTVVADEIIWEGDARADTKADAKGDGAADRHLGHPVRKHYRCTICRDQLGGGEQRHAPVDEEDRALAEAVEERSPAWRTVRDRFPVLDANGALVDQLLRLHTPRQLIGL